MRRRFPNVPLFLFLKDMGSLKYKSSQIFYQIGALQYFAIFTEKHKCRKTPLFDKATGLHVSNFIKKRLQQLCFPLNIAKFLRTVFLQNTYGCCFWIMRGFIISIFFKLFQIRSTQPFFQPESYLTITPMWIIWNKVFKNGPSKIVFHKFCLVHPCMLCPILLHINHIP